MMTHDEMMGVIATEACETLAPVSSRKHVIEGNRLAILISNCHRQLRRKYRSSPLWAMISDITGHGSTYSVEICLQCGYDPNQNCGCEKLKPKK